MELAGKLWSRSASDRHSDQRAARRVSFAPSTAAEGWGTTPEPRGTAGGRGDGTEHRQITCSAALLLPSGNDEDEANPVLRAVLDFDRSGTISLDELSDRLLAVTTWVAQRRRKKGNSRRGNGEVRVATTRRRRTITREAASAVLLSTPRNCLTTMRFSRRRPRGQATESITSERAAALEALLERLVLRVTPVTAAGSHAKLGAHGGGGGAGGGGAAEGGALAAVARRFLCRFALGAHRGEVIAAHDDGTFDVVLLLSPSEDEVNGEDDDDDGDGEEDEDEEEEEQEKTVLRGVRGRDIIPEGEWAGSGPARAWDGDAAPQGRRQRKSATAEC